MTRGEDLVGEVVLQYFNGLHTEVGEEGLPFPPPDTKPKAPGGGEVRWREFRVVKLLAERWR